MRVTNLHAPGARTRHVLRERAQRSVAREEKGAVECGPAAHARLEAVLEYARDQGCQMQAAEGACARQMPMVPGHNDAYSLPCTVVEICKIDDVGRRLDCSRSGGARSQWSRRVGDGHALGEDVGVHQVFLPANTDTPSYSRMVTHSLARVRVAPRTRTCAPVLVWLRRVREQPKVQG